MNEFVVYVLHSERHRKNYIGYTSDLVSRFRSHNFLGKKGWTINYRPWRVIFVKFFSEKAEAMKFEKYLKTGVGREWLIKHIQGNELH